MLAHMTTAPMSGRKAQAARNDELILAARTMGCNAVSNHKALMRESLECAVRARS